MLLVLLLQTKDFYKFITDINSFTFPPSWWSKQCYYHPISKDEKAEAQLG